MILITGATSGIGKACAEIFAREGDKLFLVGRRKDRLEKLARELDAEFAVLDVSDRKAVEKFSRDPCLEKVAVLINNAGLAHGADPIQEADVDGWEEMIDTNLKGLLYLTRAVLPQMVSRGDGHIVNIGSVAARFVYPKGNVYCATKAAVHALNEAMRLDLSGTGVRVTEVAPGMVETEFAEVRYGDPKKAKAVYHGMTPLSAQDIAEAVLWCVKRPKHVNVQEMVIYPTDQASTTAVARK